MDRYEEFLPERFRGAPRPVETWWSWRGQQVHIARKRDLSAPVRVMIIHGGGGHAGALWPLSAVIGTTPVEVLAPDLPLYGRTRTPEPGAVRYRDWIELLCDLVVAETRDDSRPLVLFGASMGGMLAYEVAARTGIPAAVVVTCLLDLTDRSARRAAARWAVLGWSAPYTLPAMALAVGTLRVPIRWLARMNAMSANPDLARLCATDPLGGGTRVPVGFLADWFSFVHTRPERYRGPQLTLVHPGADRWIPAEVSERFLAQISGPAHAVRLEGCGHFPVEEPGLGQLAAAVQKVFASVRL
ncbi:alpha/beta hydrolase [Williamsia sp. 1135]|nr:alpha/beta hydrolase [Williamsia sp. 1135]